MAIASFSFLARLAKHPQVKDSVAYTLLGAFLKTEKRIVFRYNKAAANTTNKNKQSLESDLLQKQAGF